MVTNDLLKARVAYLAVPICHLFNQIWANKIYPQLWATSFIIPIRKSGARSDPDNYRGVAVSSWLSKTMNSILNDRLSSFLTDNDLWRKNQCGFKKGHRIEDNHFVLQTVYNKYVTLADKNVYLAFVDFKKIFETINRKYLLYKLLKYNVTGIFMPS